MGPKARVDGPVPPLRLPKPAQTQNSHGTNLRDDLDEHRDILGTILARGLTFSVVDPYLVSRTALSTRFRDYLGHYAHSLLGVVCLGIVLNLWWGFVYTPGVLTFIAWGGIIATTAFLGLALLLSFTSHFRQILSRIWER